MLKAIPLFSNLTQSQLDSIGAHMVMRAYEKGAVILREGDAADTLYILLAGQAKVYLRDGANREVILNTFGPGDFFGEIPLFDHEPRSANVAALDRCHVQMLSYRTFKKVIEHSPEIARLLMKTLAARLRHADRQIGTLALMNISSRVSRTLLELAIVSNGRRVVGEPFTQNDLAGMIGASREMVNRTLKDLTEQGYISVQRKSITILNENLPMGSY